VAAPVVMAAVGDRFFGGRGDYFIYRNVIVAAVPLTIVAATVAGARRAGTAGTVAVALACLLLVAVSADIAHDPALQRPDVRSVAAVLRSPRSARAVVADYRTSAVLNLYVPGRVIATGGMQAGEVDVVGQPGSPPASAVLQGFRRSSVRRIQTFTVLRLRAKHVVFVNTAELRHELPKSCQVVVLYLPHG
jgi:hypothetical protein